MSKRIVSIVGTGYDGKKPIQGWYGQFGYEASKRQLELQDINTGEKLTATGFFSGAVSYPIGKLFEKQDLNGVFLLASGDDLIHEPSGHMTENASITIGLERVPVNLQRIYAHDQHVK